MMWNIPPGRGIKLPSIFEIAGTRKLPYTSSDKYTTQIINQLINRNTSCPLTEMQKANKTVCEQDHVYCIDEKHDATSSNIRFHLDVF